MKLAISLGGLALVVTFLALSMPWSGRNDNIELLGDRTADDSAGREMELHLLTPHERAMFRAQQHPAGTGAMNVKKGQQLMGVPGWGMNPNSKRMSASAANKIRSVDFSTCMSPSECHQLAIQAGMIPDAGDFPLYDDDAGEMLGAMQQQDKMILEEKQEKERRAQIVKDGGQPPKLPAVECGQECFEDQGVWCCRSHRYLS